MSPAEDGGEVEGLVARLAKGGHTPGPWMAASSASSLVGLPVVARPNGRSVASVTFFNLGEHFSNHERQSRANADLIAAAPELLDIAIQQAAEITRLRAGVERLQRIERNRDMWQGQCKGQAEQLRIMRAEVERLNKTLTDFGVVPARSPAE